MPNPYVITGVGIAILIALIIIFVPWGEVPNIDPYMPENLFTIESPVFPESGTIPAKYTCDVTPTISPPLTIRNAPGEARSLALIVVDPDISEETKRARGIEVFDHWVLFNISPETKEIEEGQSAGTHGKNGKGTNEYLGPCPPPEYAPKEHRYFFTLYALDTMLNLKEGATKDEVLAAMEGHELGSATLIGRYERLSR